MSLRFDSLSREGLKASFAVTIPADVIQADVNTRLDRVVLTARVDGFRPGKAPRALLVQRYGAGLRAEVVDEALKTAVRTLLNQEKLRPADHPRIHDLQDVPEQDVTFRLEVESLPDITLMDFAALQLERLESNVPSATVEQRMAHLVALTAPLVPLAEPRPVQPGDVLTADSVASMEGQPVPSLTFEGETVSLDKEFWPEEFEQGLIGAEVGVPREVTFTFPAKTRGPLAGKTVTCQITVREIRVHKPITLDDAFAQTCGAESLEALYSKVRAYAQQHQDALARSILKQKLLDVLDKGHDFPLPEGVVEREFAGIWAEVERQKAQGDLSAEDAAKSLDDLRAEYRRIAARRVRLGLVFSEVIQRNNLEVTREELRQAVLHQASSFQGNPEAVFTYYRNNPEAVEHLKTPILEDKAVDFILAKATLTPRTVASEELNKLSEMVS